MDSNTTTDPAKGQRPVHTIRRGAIAANIWQRQNQAGKNRYDYSISRSWKSQSSGREGYSTSFSARNTPELVEVINEATAWIAEQERDPKTGIVLARIQPVKVPASEAR